MEKFALRKSHKKYFFSVEQMQEEELMEDEE